MDYLPRFISDSELARCVPSCSLKDLQVSLLEAFDTLRAYYGSPIHITSAFRSKEYEKQKGRSGVSSHCKGLAIDIACSDSNQRLKLVISATRAGFRRIGIAKNFIHLDLDSNKPKCLWLYD